MPAPSGGRLRAFVIVAAGGRIAGGRRDLAGRLAWYEA